MKKFLFKTPEGGKVGAFQAGVLKGDFARFADL